MLNRILEYFFGEWHLNMSRDLMRRYRAGRWEHRLMTDVEAAAAYDDWSGMQW
jgi:hypothetical protein